MKDKSDRTVWIETGQGSAKGKKGIPGAVKKNQTLMMEAAVKDAAQKSATQMPSAPELRKLTQ